jgi:hypothetical protein
MPLRSRPRWIPSPSFEATTKLCAIALALYFGLVHAFAYSQSAWGSRKAVLIAVSLLNLVILAGLFRTSPKYLYPGWILPGPRRWLGFFLYALGAIALIAVILLHLDLVSTRYKGGEFGMVGRFEIIKKHILQAQFIYLIAFLLLTRLRNGQSARLSLAIDRRDLILFALPLIPLINYLAQNRADFGVGTAIEYLVFFLLIPAVIFLLMQVFQQLLNAEPIAGPVVAGLAVTYYSMPWICALLKRPVEELLFVELVLATVVPSLLTIAYWYRKEMTRQGVLWIVLLSTTGSFVQAALVPNNAGESPVINSQPAKLDEGESQLDERLSRPLKRHPDVYLLIYDAYAPASMLKTYGVENTSGLAYLKSRGFRIYDKTYSLFMMSRPSMTSVLDMRQAPQAAISGDTQSNVFFHRHGYKTHLILSSYLLQGSDRIMADVVYPPWQHRSGLDALYRGIGAGEFKSEIVFSGIPRETWLAAKRKVFSEPAGPPRMLYAHSQYPGHSQNSGSCLPDETPRYADRLLTANKEMKEDVEAILSTDRDAIIMVAGDHGPHLTGDCLYMKRYNPAQLEAVHLRDRYGMLLAIRWPHGAPRAFENIRLLQEVFFAVASYMLDDPHVWDERMRVGTAGLGGIPDGAVQDGMVMVGKDRGRPLFE